jgi:hypothetical protein
MLMLQLKVTNKAMRLDGVSRVRLRRYVPLERIRAALLLTRTGDPRLFKIRLWNCATFAIS